MRLRLFNFQLASILLCSGLAAQPACGLPQQAPGGDLPRIVSLIEQGKFREAETQLHAELQRDPNSFTAYRVLGYVWLQQQRYTQAEKALEESLRISPKNNPQALFLLVQAKFALKKPVEALALA